MKRAMSFILERAEAVRVSEREREREREREKITEMKGTCSVPKFGIC